MCDELSQAEFAKRLGISAANLCDLEKGRKVPSLNRVVKIARKLGISDALLVQVALQDMLKRGEAKIHDLGDRLGGPNTFIV